MRESARDEASRMARGETERDSRMERALPYTPDVPSCGAETICPSELRAEEYGAIEEIAEVLSAMAATIMNAIGEQ